MEMSQEGIGKTFDVRQSSISRVINKMLKEGLVSERGAYVTGSKQRRKIYHLSHRGYQFALETKRVLEEMIITIYIDNEPRDVELKKVNEHLTSPMNILDILRNLGPRGELDVSTLVKMGPRTKKEAIVYGDPIPKGRAFVGRVRELNSLQRWLSSKSVSLVCIHGVAGIGKTAMVVKLMDSLEEKDMFYLRIRDWSTLNSVLSSLGAFLSRTGRRRMASKVKKEGPVDLKEILSILEAELRDLDAVLIFDDFHSVNEAMRPFFIELIEALPRTKAHALVLTRYTEPFYDRRSVIVKGCVKEMRLGGLAKKDCVAILKDKGLDKGTVDRIYKVTGGHPLSLELIGILGDLKEVDKFVFEEIYSTLTSNEKRLLQLTSVFRDPVPLDVLLEVGPNETIEELERKALINMVGDGHEIQDLLREFFHNRTSPKVLREMHALAKEHYASKEGPRALLEQAYHTFHSGNKGEAIDLIISKADQLVQEGMADDMIALIDGFGGMIPKDRYRDAYNLREKAANVWGTWDNYLEYMFECRYLEGLLGLQLKAPTMALRVSFLGRSAEDTDRTLEDLERTITILKKVGDEHGIGHTRYTLSWIRWVRGEFVKARKGATSLLQMDMDDDLRARTMMLLGGLELETGHGDEAKAWFSKANKVYTKMTSIDGQVQARVFEASAEMPLIRKDGAKTLARSKRRLTGATDLAHDNRLHRAMAYGTLRSAQALMMEDPARAIEAAEEAVSCFLPLHDPLGLTFARATKAIAMMRTDRPPSEAIELLSMALEELDKACLDRLAGIVHLFLEKVYSKSGDTFGAESSRKKAESLGVVPRRR
jgi:ATP/maltotriose-dependent transcriptional regulator MalT/DNA-binding PadR family transcriptional regulator